jgi:hypothetical protein
LSDAGKKTSRKALKSFVGPIPTVNTQFGQCLPPFGFGIKASIACTADSKIKENDVVVFAWFNQ